MDAEAFSERMLSKVQKDFNNFLGSAAIGPAIKKANFKEEANAIFAAGFASGMEFVQEERNRLTNL